MIQGLGEKHQSLLHAKWEDQEKLGERPEETACHRQDEQEMAKVKTWAATVSDGQERVPGDIAEKPADRENHFDRDLKEVRLGESPSRPWGIQVPLEASLDRPKSPHASDGNPDHVFHQEALSDAVGADRSELNSNNAPDRPQDRPIFLPSHRVPPPSSPPVSKEEPLKSQPPMVFTGPVFIGYSVEQAAELLRLTGLGTGGERG